MVVEMDEHACDMSCQLTLEGTPVSHDNYKLRGQRTMFANRR